MQGVATELPSPRGRYLEAELVSAIERIAVDDRPITLVVGAGASMEAALPSWRELVETLVAEAAQDHVRAEHAREEWGRQILEEGFLAAAAVVRALAADEARFVERVRQALYRQRPPSSYVPQALAQQVAWFKRQVPDTTIITGNYDGLLEQALRDEGLTVHSYVQWRSEPPDSAAVYHIHGRLIPAYPSTSRIVLSEEDYAQIQSPGSWQERFMRNALDSTLCIFLGLSLTDPNLIRWLYRYAAEPVGQLPHVALFVRQATPALDDDLRGALEDGARARWRRCGVQPIWADFFGESAQFIHEIACRRAGLSLTPFLERATERFEEGRQFLAPEDEDAFRLSQDRVSPFLARLLGRVRQIAAADGVDLSDEELGLGMWGADHAAGTLTCWVTSDRRFNSPRSLVAQPLEYDSPWVAVQAVTRGVVVQEDPNVFASRWRLVRGIPIVVQDGVGASRSIVGALTLTSMTPATGSRLATAPRGLLGAIDRTLAELAAPFFAPS